MATAGWRRATFVAVFLSCWKGFSDAQIVDTFSSCENLLPIESFRETDFPDVTTTVRAGEPVINGQPFFEITTTVGALLSSFSYQVFGVIDGQILPVGVIIGPSRDFPCGQASVVGVPQPETDAGISEYMFFWVPLQVDLSTISALLLRCVAVRGNQYEVFEQLLINVLDANVCSPNPCQNGGQCTANVQLQTANCNCIQGFQGLICDRVSENNAPSYPVCPLLSRVTSLAENIGNFVTWMIEDCADTEDGSITPVCNPLSGSLFDLGVSGVTCTCTDSADVSTHCVFLVIVLPVNNAPSTPVCPPVAPRPTIPGNIGNLLSWVIEDCSDVEDTSISPVCDPPSGSFFTVGSRLVTCSCTDSGGLSSQCTFTATVLSEDFSCYVCRGEDQCSRSIQQLQTVSCGPGSICAFVNVTFVLGSGGAPISQLFRDCVEDRTQTAGCVTASSYLNDYIAADFPSIDIISEFGTACFCDVDLCEPEFAVVCSPNPCQNGGTCIPQGPSTFICDCPPGFSRPVCGAPPSRPNCPTDPINERVPLGTSSLALFFGPVTCTTAQLQTITATCTPASGSNFNVGVTNVTCVCTNVVNDVPLRSSCNFQVNVTQVCPVPNPCQNGGTCVPGGLSSFICNCPPGFSRPFCATRPSPPDCPSAPITVQAAPGSQVTVAVFGPFFCDIAPPQQIGILLATCTPSSGSLFGLGLTTVVCVCSDGSATSACEFDVNVLEAPGPCNPNPCRNNGTCVVTGTFETNICLCPPRIFGDMCQFPMVDTNPPLIVGCPDDITIDVDLSSGGTEVSFTEPTAIDDSGVDILSRSHAPGDFFTVGETTVVYIFEDFSGNNATCEFRVVVNPGLIQIRLLLIVQLVSAFLLIRYLEVTS
ncbi:Hyalin [Holothuria leucospilota]|uniref:Hyalin n=1 Tax=Holothuria leucospilota TaxID=206669 RepID=A0A9Q1CBX0_HOLLE|nr:Hyalin [Holothuria leucospilota]